MGFPCSRHVVTCTAGPKDSQCAIKLSMQTGIASMHLGVSKHYAAYAMCDTKSAFITANDRDL